MSEIFDCIRAFITTNYYPAMFVALLFCIIALYAIRNSSYVFLLLTGIRDRVSGISLSWMKTTALTVLASFIFTTLSAPFAQGSIWEDRRKAVEKMKQTKEQTENAWKPAARRQAAAAAEKNSGQGSARISSGVSAPVNLNFQSAASGLEIPEDLGTIVESWGGTGGEKMKGLPRVIHIQDAHGVYEAQKNAANILRLVQTESGGADDLAFSSQMGAVREPPLLVCVEGAWGRVLPDWMSVFPDDTAKRSVAESLLEKG